MAIVRKRSSIRLRSTRNMRLGISVAGGPYMEMDDVNSIDYSAGSRPVEQVPFFGGSAAETGSVPVEGVAIGLGTYDPNLLVHAELNRANRAGLSINARIDMYGSDIISNTVASAGTVAQYGFEITAANIALNLGKGAEVTMLGSEILSRVRDDELSAKDLILEDATTAFKINRVEYDDAAPNDTTKMKVYVTKQDGSRLAASDAVSTRASVYSIRTSGLRIEFACTVGNENSFSAEASSSQNLGGNLMLQPKTLLARGQPLLVDEADAGW